MADRPVPEPRVASNLRRDIGSIGIGAQCHVMLSRYDFAERDTPWIAGLPKLSFTPGAHHLLHTAYLFNVDFVTR